jgi:hypothetical protein
MKQLFNNGEIAVTKDEIKKDEVFDFLNYKWQVVNVKEEMATLWMKNPNKRVLFNIDDDMNKTDYETSHIREVLKKWDIPEELKRFILPGYLDDMFWLPSYDEVKDGGEWDLSRQEREFNSPNLYWMWLRSAYSTAYLYSVSNEGNIHYNYYTNYPSYAYVGLRPAFNLDIRGLK